MSGVGGGEGVDKELGEDLVGVGVGEEVDGGDAAGNDGPGVDERGEVARRGRGLVDVALREVVNPRMQHWGLDRDASAGPPDFGGDRAGLRRLRRRHSARHDG